MTPSYRQQIETLAEEAIKLVGMVPADVIDSIVDALMSIESSSQSGKRSAVNEAIGNPGFRKHVGRFMDLWVTHHGLIDSHTIAGLFFAAKRVREIHKAEHSIEVTWTGPGGDSEAFRHSEQALIELIEAAEKRLLVVSYAVYSIENVQGALLKAAKRGVDVTVIVDGQPGASAKDEYDTIAAMGKQIAMSCSLFYWPEAKRPKGSSGKPAKLHAKVAVADGKRFLITSANLTSYAFDLNMELGVLATGTESASAIEKHFAKLISSGELERV